MPHSKTKTVDRPDIGVRVDFLSSFSNQSWKFTPVCTSKLVGDFNFNFQLLFCPIFSEELQLFFLLCDLIDQKKIALHEHVKPEYWKFVCSSKRVWLDSGRKLIDWNISFSLNNLDYISSFRRNTLSTLVQNILKLIFLKWQWL